MRGGRWGLRGCCLGLLRREFAFFFFWVVWMGWDLLLLTIWCCRMMPRTPMHWAVLNAVAAGLPVGYLLSPLLTSA